MTIYVTIERKNSVRTDIKLDNINTYNTNPVSWSNS